MTTGDTPAPDVGGALIADVEAALPVIGELVKAANPGVGLALELLPVVVPEVQALIQDLMARTGATAPQVASIVSSAGQHIVNVTTTAPSASQSPSLSGTSMDPTQS